IAGSPAREDMEQPKFDDDGIDRRHFLKCMAWAGSGLMFTITGGIPKSIPLASLFAKDPVATEELKQASFSFAQISDSHIGFSKDANKDVIATLRTAVDRI